MSRRVEIPPTALPAPGGRALFRTDGRDIALFDVEGALYAIDDSCPHQGASLLGGELGGRMVKCRAHGLRFDLATGCMPGVTGFGVRSYAIERDAARVFLLLPESPA